MIPALLAPAALGALLAVLVPLAIHIARRPEPQTIDFAALRWLNPNPKPVQRLRVDERLLLAVRIALMVTAVLALAEPVLRPTGDGRPVVAVSPAADARSVPDRGERRAGLCGRLAGFGAGAEVDYGRARQHERRGGGEGHRGGDQGPQGPDHGAGDEIAQAVHCAHHRRRRRCQRNSLHRQARDGAQPEILDH